MGKAAVVRTIQNGALKIELREYADGRFGFDWQTENYSRKMVRKRGLAKAEEEARKLLGASKAGTLDLLKIDPAEYAEFLQWKAQRRRGASIPDLVAAFLANKTSKGRSAKHLRGLTYNLESFAAAFPVPIDTLTRSAVEQWLDARGVGPRRWNNLLADVVALVRFARRDGMLSAELTPVELIDRRNVVVTVATYTPDEMRRLLATCWPEWLPTIALQGFSGLRPEEVCPEKDSKKAGVQWENILWEKGKIDIPATISKTRRRRFAPLTDATRAALQPLARTSGPIAPPVRFWRFLSGWKARDGIAWKPDGLRHSFASYRLAITQDAPALALEMGNSPSMIFRHYLDLKHREQAEEWFSLRPPTV